MTKVLITGASGFIGFHLVHKLVQNNYDVVGLDNINDYYDINLKYGRLLKSGIRKETIEYGRLIDSEEFSRYKFIKLNLEDQEGVSKLFDEQKFDFVVHLAAQAGVRYSLKNPNAYISSNIVGFANILESCRCNYIKHLVYASSSSVYGLNKDIPFSTKDNVDRPISLYAASKKSNELMAHVYSHLFKIPTTGLRFFTVYGAWGRPDMALFLFTKAIVENRPIDIYNNGEMQRDFTYIDDVVGGIKKALERIPIDKSVIAGKPSSIAPYKIYNIGNSSPVKLVDFVSAIEESLGMTAKKNMMPIQPGDVVKTWADVSDSINDLGYKPNTNIKTGVQKFTDWYKMFYNIN